MQWNPCEAYQLIPIISPSVLDVKRKANCCCKNNNNKESDVSTQIDYIIIKIKPKKATPEKK
jgi:hypothetical protein